MRMRTPREVAPDFERDVQLACAGQGDPAYFGRLAAESPAAVEWLQSFGVEFASPGYYLSVAPPRIQPVGGGSAVLDRLLRAARACAIEFHYECEARRLARGAGDALAGVEFRTGDGTAKLASCAAVVLACGGFEGDAAMLAEHFGPQARTLRPISPGTRYNTGLGIRMACELGARRAGDWNGMHIEPVDARSRKSAPVVLVYPYGILVDRAGSRFCDEGAGLMHETWERLARTIHFSTPGGMAWSIHDRSLLEIEGYERAIRSDVPPMQAGSIGELAAIAGISAAGLERTIAQYNAAARGDPARFDAGRADGLAAAADLAPPKSNWARPIRKPPYLAYPLVGAIAYTFGGVATNEEAEVLGENGVIPGLYAAGEITGHFHHTAPNAVAIMRALVFGRIAGANAARHALLIS